MCAGLVLGTRLEFLTVVIPGLSQVVWLEWRAASSARQGAGSPAVLAFCGLSVLHFIYFCSSFLSPPYFALFFLTWSLRSLILGLPSSLL